MNLNDFRCMRRGVQVSTLRRRDADLLRPFKREGKEKNHALLLLHGFSSSPAVFRNLLGAFAGYDAVVAPVLPGHSENLNAFAEVKASDWLASVEDVCATLVAEFQQVDIMGLSLGGLLACHLSSRFPLNHLYLLAPALDLQLALPGSLKLARILYQLGFRQLRSAAGNLFTTDHCEIAYRQLPLTTIIEILTLVKQFEFKPPTCPTDVFLGCYDEVVASRRVAARFAGCDNVTIHWLAKSAHVLPLDGDIAEIIQCVNQNLATG
ncbi:alpha/beta hydrolase [Legionella taurinensis]|uniref:Alpha/beta fold hydrolase n=1 Tax=Legionella taurinensis TaxID=70611 RepID=A0A3A5L6T9_9GAMM|nr:alpha/beta fold hydrolase [Legionella taurinensis]RJT48752.1 alpha/beta fold hydrolase [Legionella taurinensis]RJT69742.1 alpha/beta fold hydrolase [Legionella taurinensis]STY24893.1 carboxylesterase [Legionella taurinensis]